MSCIQAFRHPFAVLSLATTGTPHANFLLGVTISVDPPGMTYSWETLTKGMDGDQA